ncbi:MAG TPA: pyridoxamine 5'-phosphate oxidase [Chitinophagaceae bacterium]|jgi:pyridoxamine 5'-phosphate oxidase
MDSKISSIRTEYAKQSLLESDVSADPIDQFGRWWQQAVDAEVPEVNAMTVATASPDGMPSARILLLKEFSEHGFVFFTNYNSFKGQQLTENPRACLVFFWKELERQVRIMGMVKKTTIEVSDAYFASRPKLSQAGAVVSPQSQVVESREWLEDQFKKFTEDPGNAANIIRPPHWGGFQLKPVIIEFWQGRPSRLHDRLQYSLTENGNWKIERLAP